MIARTRSWITRYGVVAALVAMSIVASVAAPGFFSLANASTILLHVSINGILTLGMTFVIITAGIDLSVGSLLGFAGVLVAGALTAPGLIAVAGVGGAAVVATLIGLAVGAAVGVANGALTAYLGINPFIVTLAMMTVARGAARLVTGGIPIGFPPMGDPHFAAKVGALDALHAFGGGRIPIPGTGQGFPVPALVMLALVFLSAVLLERTRFGRYVYAVGGNEEAARLSGVPVRGVKVGVYAIAGACAGLAGVLMVGQLRSGGPDAGLLYELNAIAAAVIGGASLMGGIGSAWGALTGALLIGVLNNSLDLMGVQAFWQEIAKGAIILLAVLFDVWTKQRNGGSSQ
ncbi:MAG TPA: ABC transporter permease [Gemmatimonadales bacterium]|jgi:ribose/xylose/arabinose/galactoside ABC-type transport system permease subunit|nr:ABC transporter permease [Gemmatimonadales bacterium]